jgi:hypothetical protein
VLLRGRRVGLARQLRAKQQDKLDIVPVASRLSATRGAIARVSEDDSAAEILADIKLHIVRRQMI